MEQLPAVHVRAPLNDPTPVEMHRLDSATRQPTASREEERKASWWQRHIAQDVPFEKCRDYYALERTYLAWVRTSVKFAHFGVVVAQLFRLPQNLVPSSPLVSQFYRLGKPLGLVSISIALLAILVGGFRCWQQQQYIESGKVRTCGWEIWIILLFTLGYVVVVLVFAVGDASSGKPY